MECRLLPHEAGWYRWARPPLRRVQIQGLKKIGEYLVVDSPEGLVALVQGDIVEIHCWNSTGAAVEPEPLGGLRLVALHRLEPPYKRELSTAGSRRGATLDGATRDCGLVAVDVQVDAELRKQSGSRARVRKSRLVTFAFGEGCTRGNR